MLQIYNTLTKEKAPLKTLEPNKVKLYVCGMTVYDYCHIGHARVLVSFDMITRYLRHLGYEVDYVCNITDIDDKIITRANENKEDFHALTSRFIDAMHEDEKKLNILPPDKEPKATDFIPSMIHIIEKLIKNNYAYVGQNGDVYYAVHKFEHYGALAHQTTDKLRSGARVAITESKTDPLDFVLWKLAKPNEPSWDSPWGKGRPGWHIECSAMSMDCLGEKFDIHGGGFDLIFPHHQNEIAQSEGATGHTVVDQWMHVGFVTINKEKMSKSLGNFFTIRDVLKEYSPEVIRYFMLTSQYRSQLNYSKELLDQAQSALERLYLSLRNIAVPHLKSDIQNTFITKFHEAMQDDFNTPIALSVLFDLAREINKTQDEILAGTLKNLGNLLGILEQDPEDFLKQNQHDVVAIEKIEKLILERNAARAEKNWAKSDQIRDELQLMGIIIEDAAGKTTWRKTDTKS
jgi:cysteinyl-tRNA synthetase